VAAGGLQVSLMAWNALPAGLFVMPLSITRTAIAALGALLGLSGCMSDDEAIRQEVRAKAPSYQAETYAYYLCNAKASRAYASQQGDPVSIAFAARSACTNERNALLTGLVRAYDPSRGGKLMAASENSALEQNTVTVVEARAGR
jgi:hypothetical protein